MKKKILIIIFCLFIILGLCSCLKEKQIGDFSIVTFTADTYKGVGKLKMCSVVGYRGNSETKEVVIPNKIGKYYVKFFGAHWPTITGGDASFDVGTAETIYLNSDLEMRDFFKIFQSLEKLYIPYFTCKNFPAPIKKLYVSNEFSKLSEFTEQTSKLENKEEIIIANVSYNYNYSECIEYSKLNTFFIDNVYNDLLVNIPPDPIRFGYTFDGWYKEKECINKWDFKNDKVPSALYDENNQLIYNETILYAKWI